MPRSQDTEKDATGSGEGDVLAMDLKRDTLNGFALSLRRTTGKESLGLADLSFIDFHCESSGSQMLLVQLGCLK